MRVWDLPLRLFHWLLVLAIALAFLSSDEDSPLNQWHILSGWVAAILIVFRVTWGFAGGEHSQFVDFVRPSRIGEHVAGLFRGQPERTLGHNPLGGVSVITLLVLIAAVVSTGAFGGERSEDLHGLIAWILLAFVGFHIAAVLIMSLLQRENLVAAMITGKKNAARHAGAVDARRPSVVGILVAIVVLAATTYGILQYDPRAFTLRRAELEQPASASGEVSAVSGQSKEDD